MVIDDERSMETFEERLYFMNEAERQEFLEGRENPHVVEEVDEETELSRGLESAATRLQSIIDGNQHRKLTADVIEHVWDFFHP
jgi:hypothetical protein